MKCYLKFPNQIVMYAFWTLNPHVINFLYSLIMIHAAVVESDLFGFSIYFYSICTLGLGPGESMIQDCLSKLKFNSFKYKLVYWYSIIGLLKGFQISSSW